MLETILVEFLILTNVVSTFDNMGTSRDTEILYDTLLTGYHKHVRPGTNQSKPTDIHVGFEFANIQEFDEKTERFAIIGYFHLLWIDERLSWDPLRYNNTTQIHLPTSSVWLPDLLILNPFDECRRLDSVGGTLIYNFKGEAMWLAGDQFEIKCNAYINNYPFDEQTCTLRFSHWGYLDYEERFIPIPNAINYEFYFPNGKWNITSSRMYIMSLGHFEVIHLEFRFRRHSHFHVINTIIPIILLEILQTFVFLIPVESGERLGFATTMLLAISVYMTIVADRLPDISYPSISYLSYFLLSDVICGVILIVCLVQSLQFHHSHDTTGDSKCFRLIRNCCKRPQRKVDVVEDGGVQQYGDNNPGNCDLNQGDAVPETGHRLCEMFDKICSYWFLLVNFIKVIVLFVLLGKG